MRSTAEDQNMNLTDGTWELHHHRLPLHIFEVMGKHHVFDPESGKFFRIDRITSELLPLVPQHSHEEILNILGKKYRKRAIQRVQEEISGLIDAGLIYCEGIEYGDKPEPFDIKPFLFSVTLNVASTCNMQCRYCWNKGGAFGRVKKEKLMSEEVALRAIDLTVENSPEDGDILVDFYGGETLLNFDVLRSTMRYCREIEKKTKKTFSFKITTNGTLLTQEMIDCFNEMGVSLGVSIDGTKKTHNLNRPFPDGRGTWDLIMKNIRPAVEANNIHVSARATLAPPDLDLVKATKGLFKCGFFDTEVEFASESCEAFNPGGFPQYSEKDIEKMKKEYLRFAKFYLGYTLYRDEAIDIGLSNNIGRVLHEYHRFSPCGAGNGFITVTEEGLVYPCMGFIGMDEYVLGDVEKGIDLERLKMFRHKMQSVTYEAEECINCWARHICAGNCPANNEQHNKDIFKPHGRGCEWLKFKLEVAMWAASEISLKKPSRLEGYRPVR